MKQFHRQDSTIKAKGSATLMGTATIVVPYIVAPLGSDFTIISIHSN